MASLLHSCFRHLATSSKDASWLEAIATKAPKKKKKVIAKAKPADDSDDSEEPVPA